MVILGIIPARFASTRFPSKPLADIGGKAMIQRVYEQAKKATSLTDVIVATDDERIAENVKNFGGKVILTSPLHANGSERCNEVAQQLEADVIINIQGDEPFIYPEQIDQLAALFTDSKVQIGTLIKVIKNVEDLTTASIIKAVVNKQNEALYFSRNQIPHLRDVTGADVLSQHIFYKHIGIYGFRKEVLNEIVKLPISALEKAESLEQLRWLENGYRIQTAVTEYESISVDVPADLERVRKLLQ